MRANALGHLGNPASYTPNIDALAEDGVSFDKDSRMPDDFYLETINAFLKFRISPLIKGAMKLTRSDFTTLAQKGMKLFRIGTNKFYKK